MRLNKGEVYWGLIGSNTAALMVVEAQWERVYGVRVLNRLLRTDKGDIRFQ